MCRNCPGICSWKESKPTTIHIIRRKPRILLSKYERWRRMAKAMNLSKETCRRLEWFIWHESQVKKDVSLTCRHFGIARKTFYKWHNRFDETNLRTIETKTSTPHTFRKKEYTYEQYCRVVTLRRIHIRYGKMKLLSLYQEEYPKDEAITSWKIQCIIEKSGIYYHPQKQARINKKRQRSVNRKKITDLKAKRVRGFLLCLDTVVRYWQGRKRYVFTAIDRYSKVTFARMYNTHSSSCATDFLCRLYYLLDGKIENIQTDNGSEFHKHFDEACRKLKIPHYYSRVKTPKDNAVNERFNRTLQEEFIQMGNMTDNTVLFNERLTEWLVEYNFKRPHQSLGYIPPMNFHFKYHKVLPTYPSSTSA